MADQQDPPLGPDDKTADQTGGTTTPPPATDDNSKPPATPPPSSGDDDDVVTLPRKDYNALVSQRDKNFSAKGELEERVDGMENELAKRDFIRDMKKKYPDVPKSVLEMGNSPDSVEEIAKTFQRKVQDKQQKALEEMQKVGVEPTITKKDAKQMLAELEKSDDPKKFEKMVDIQMRIEK